MLHARDLRSRDRLKDEALFHRYFLRLVVRLKLFRFAQVVHAVRDDEDGPLLKDGLRPLAERDRPLVLGESHEPRLVDHDARRRSQMEVGIRLFGALDAEAHLHIWRDVEMPCNDKHVLRVPAHRFKRGAPAVCERMHKLRPRLELTVRIISLILVGKQTKSTQITEVFVGIFVARTAVLTIILRQVRRVHHDGRCAARSQHVHGTLAGGKDQRDAREGVRDAEALKPEGRFLLDTRGDQDVVEARRDRCGLHARHKNVARVLTRNEDGMLEGIELDFHALLRHCGGAKGSGDGTGKE